MATVFILENNVDNYQKEQENELHSCHWIANNVFDFVVDVLLFDNFNLTEKYL